MDKIYNPLSVPELSSSPSAPSSGYQKIYAKTDGKLYVKDSSDTETELTNVLGGGASLNQIYPIGCIYTTTVSTNPSTVFGFGTWVSFASGRVLVGVDGSQSEFDTVEETGGAKTHTLTVDEIPSHTHTQDAHSHSITDPGHNHSVTVYSTDANGNFFDRTNGGGASGTASVDTNTTGITIDSATATNQNTGGGQSHNNLQPYITVYFWKRTA
jgi:microcystin-dependent protein